MRRGASSIFDAKQTQLIAVVSILCRTYDFEKKNRWNKTCPVAIATYLKMHIKNINYYWKIIELS